VPRYAGCLNNDKFGGIGEVDNVFYVSKNITWLGKLIVITRRIETRLDEKSENCYYLRRFYYRRSYNLQCMCV